MHQRDIFPVAPDPVKDAKLILEVNIKGYK